MDLTGNLFKGETAFTSKQPTIPVEGRTESKT